MKAVVFHHPKKVTVDDVPDAQVKVPTDAVVRITATAICGSDLHIYNGLIPQPGRSCSATSSSASSRTSAAR